MCPFCVNSFHSHNSPAGMCTITIPSLQKGHRCTEKLSDFAKITQPGKVEPVYEATILAPERLLLNAELDCLVFVVETQIQSQLSCKVAKRNEM